MHIISGPKNRIFKIKNLLDTSKYKKVLFFDLEGLEDVFLSEITNRNFRLEYYGAAYIDVEDVSLGNLSQEGARLFKEFDALILFGHFFENQIDSLSRLEQFLKVDLIVTI